MRCMHDQVTDKDLASIVQAMIMRCMHDQATDKDLTSTVQAMIMRCMHDQRQEGVVSDKCCVALSTPFSKSKFMESILC